MRGGEGTNYSLSPANIDLGRGSGMQNSLDVQVAAGMAGGRRGRRSRRGGARRRTTRRASRARRSRRSRR